MGRNNPAMTEAPVSALSLAVAGVVFASQPSDEDRGNSRRRKIALGCSVGGFGRPAAAEVGLLAAA